LRRRFLKRPQRGNQNPIYPEIGGILEFSSWGRPGEKKRLERVGENEGYLSLTMSGDRSLEVVSGEVSSLASRIWGGL